jgi:predicted flap endonuclease-1-like 5' DNA nuclease
MMSIQYISLALLACFVSGIVGAFSARFKGERKRQITEQEDPRDTKIRDLQARIKLIDDDIKRDRASAKEATEHVALAHERIIKLLDEAKNLKHSLESQESLKDNNKDEIELLHEKLSAANKQLDTLRQRNQEMEVELSVVNEPDMLATKDADDDDHNDDAEVQEADPFTPTVTDDSPSLIHALTDELDRWKRHCHVLGDELKIQRTLVNETDEAVDDSTTSIQVIDELIDIRGIGAVLARKLHKLGIYSYQKLLNLSDDDLERARQLIPDFERRMARDNWLDQARALQAIKPIEGAERIDYSARA